MLVILVARLTHCKCQGNSLDRRVSKDKRNPYTPSTTLVSQTLTAERPPDMAVNCCGPKILTFDKKDRIWMHGYDI